MEEASPLQDSSTKLSLSIGTAEDVIQQLSPLIILPAGKLFSSEAQTKRNLELLQELQSGVESAREFGTIDKVGIIAAGSELAAMATSCATQIILVGMAIQLNQIGRKLDKVVDEIQQLQRDFRQEGEVEFFSAIEEFQTASDHYDEVAFRDQLLHVSMAVRKAVNLNIGYCREQIDQMPAGEHSWRNTYKIHKLRKDIEERLTRAEEYFRLAILGAQVLAECLSLLADDKAAAEYLDSILQIIIKSELVERAIEAARTVKFSKGLETTWITFKENAPIMLEGVKKIMKIKELVATEPSDIKIEVSRTE